MAFNGRGLGYRPSHEAGYRPPMNMAVPHLPSAKPKGDADNMWQLPPAYDQGSLGSCVWQMIAQLVVADNAKDADADGTPSRLFGYYNTRVLQNDVQYDDGCNPETAMAAGAKWGFAPEKFWPYDIEEFRRLPPSKAYREAYKRRGPFDLLWIDSTGDQRVNDVKVALDEGYCVGICGLVGPEYGNWHRGDDPLGVPPGWYSGNPDYGGHARLIGAYDGDVFVERGSWGEEFGDGGNVLINSDLIAWRKTSELVIFRKAPGI